VKGDYFIHFEKFMFSIGQKGAFYAY
jgi:hypothetical protein